jgi:DNA modification methylase
MHGLNATQQILMSKHLVLIEGNFEDVVDGLPLVDLIFTDPPYPRKLAIPCYEMLAEFAPQLLVDGGSLVTIVPHYLLEEVMEMFKDRLKYRWIYNMDQEQGSHPRMAMGIEVCWKPMLHYVKRAYPQGRGFLRDKVDIPAPEKDMHKWQQAEAWADYYVPKLTKPGDVVLDPFMGTATVGAAALKNGRDFIGIDNDPEVFKTAEERLWSTTIIAPGVGTELSTTPAPRASAGKRSAAA